MCVSLSQHGHQDPVYVAAGARGAQREGATLPPPSDAPAPHLPPQDQHSHHAAARRAHQGVWLAAALSYGHHQVEGTMRNDLHKKI